MDALDFIQIDPLTYTGIGVSLFCGFIVGLERQISGKPAGIRTSILICLGAYAYVTLSTHISGESIDRSRVLGQIITGIGFLGAGVMLTRKSRIIGVTSAAIIWMLAAMGSMVGFERYGSAVTLALLSISVLWGINFLERKIKSFRKGVHENPDEDDN